MKKSSPFLSLATVLVFASLAISCDKDTTPTPSNDVYTVNATLSAANEVPALNTVTFPGTGTVTGSYNSTSNVLSYSVMWSGLSGIASVGHFHGPALAGVNASPIIYYNLINSGSTGTASGTITLTEAQETDMLAGKWYANIHTATNGGGEIRGQVTATK